MSLTKLPIGIQSFNKLREGGFVYVDQTRHALELIDTYQYIFLTRPRRFGKSLFLDTLYNIFLGNKELFRGLYIYDKYDFAPYPVIRISWGGDFSTQESTEETVQRILIENAERLGISCERMSVPICF